MRQRESAYWRTYMHNLQRQKEYRERERKPVKLIELNKDGENFPFLTQTHAHTHFHPLILTNTYMQTHTHRHSAVGYTSQLWQSSPLLFLLLVSLSSSTACVCIAGCVRVCVCVESARRRVKDATSSSRVSQLLPSFLPLPSSLSFPLSSLICSLCISPGMLALSLPLHLLCTPLSFLFCMCPCVPLRQLCVLSSAFSVFLGLCYTVFSRHPSFPCLPFSLSFTLTVSLTRLCLIGVS